MTRNSIMMCDLSKGMFELKPKLSVAPQVAMMYRHLLKLPTTSRVQLEPFTFQQTKALMQVGNQPEMQDCDG